MAGPAAQPATSKPPAGCASRESLEVFALDGSASPEFSRHVSECLTCSAALEEIRAENALAAELAGAARSASSSPTVSLGAPAGAADDLINGYRLEGELHRGGQGVVFRAFQHATKRHVAVKMLLGGHLAGPKELARFEREIELVASLKHPGIVTVYHSGLTARSQPFVAMELIDGVRLSEYAWRLAGAERAHAQPATGRTGWTSDLLRLFVRICNAVHFAHQRGIIHRDLKPSNILVTPDGQPHVLDFGIAKLAGAEAVGSDVTRSGDFVGTFAYAAPEQLAGETGAIDVRTDVYALGVILYEVLTGKRPYTLDGPLAKIVSAVMSAAPAPPARAGRPLDEELSAIVLKALAKEPERRYQSAAALGEDLERYLSHRPIAARRDSTWYVLRKTLRRYRVAAAAALLVFLLILGSGATLAVMYLKKNTAQQAKGKTLDAFVGALGQVEQDQSNDWIATVTDFLDQAALIADRNLTNYPADLAKVDTSLAMGYMTRREPAKALEHINRALEIRRGLYRAPHPAIAQTLHDLGRVRYYAGDDRAAAEAFRQALSMREACRPVSERALAETMHFLASVLNRLGEYKEAEGLYNRSLEIRRRILTPDDPDYADIANTLNGLAVCLRQQRRTVEAVSKAEEALAMVQRIAGKDDWRAARVMGALAAYLIDLKEFDRAGDYLRRSLEIKRREGASEVDIASTLSKMARLELRRGEAEKDPARYDTARTQAAEAIEIRRRVHRGPHPDLAEELMLMGMIEMARRQPAEAEKWLHEAYDMRRELLPEGNWQVGWSESLWGECLAQLGEFEKAAEKLESADRKVSAALKPEDERVRRVLERAEALYTAWGKPEKAAEFRARIERAAAPKAPAGAGSK